MASGDVKAPRLSRKAKIGIAIGIAAVAVIAAIVAAIMMLRPSSPALTDDQVKSDVELQDWNANGVLTTSQWGENDNYSVESCDVTSIDPVNEMDNSVKTCSAHVEVHLANSSFRMIINLTRNYCLENEDYWVLADTVLDNKVVEPIGKVSDERIVASMPTFIEQVDKVAKKSYDQSALMDLYGNGATFEVVKNDTGTDGGSAQVRMTKNNGMYKCEGVMTVDFSFGGNDWSVADCSVDEGAYTKDYSAMIGEHMGVFDRVQGINKSTRHCYGGRATPFAINVKSYDPVGSTITADISFTVHNHLDPDNNVEQSEGDSVYTAQDVMIKLENTNGYQTVYEKEDVNGAADIRVLMQFSEDSTVAKVHVEDSYWPSGKWDTFDDYYTVDFAKAA